VTANEPRERVEVTATVTIGAVSKTFTADSTTVGDPHHAAAAILDAVWNDAGDWIRQSRKEARL
jgi:hypothetical protein